MIKNDNAIFQTKLNQVNHEFEIYFDAGAGQSDTRQYPINPNSIVNLSIEETLADWVTKGSLTFFYNPEAGSNTYHPDTGQIDNAQTGIKSSNARSFYYFRNDGNDLLRIRITPKLSPGNSIPGAPDITITNPVHWTLSYLFSIYDMEDVDLPPGAQNQASASIKCLKVYFWDEWYQKMITNTLEYSTALSQYADIEGDKASTLYANPGAIYTGQAMKEIIEKSLEGVDSTDGVPIKSSEWEDGAAKIFYTAPAYATAYDNLMYILDRHISAKSTSPTTNDLSILLKDRGPTETDVGQLALKPVSDFFDKAGNSPDAPGEYQTEHFFLQGYTEREKTRPTKTYRGPTSKTTNDNIDLKSLKYGTISNYRFVDISALTNTTQFCTTPVYSFDFKERTFNVEFQNNTVLTARKFMSEKYIDKVYTNGGGEKLFLITLDEDKKSKNIKPAFSLYGDDPIIRQHAGLQKLLYLGLFQNACVNFRTLGLTTREPGRFIAIDRTEGVESGDYEDKFYGQWFVINVKHVIESEIYYNDITAIKIHRFEALKPGFVGTL